ncbi:MAG: hypothetical protein GY812_12195 [Actinomycetia bacterium]|nr:hypothetical protein [Actinomycetes bacterium]
MVERVEMAAFPLGTVLLPGQLMPLQVFEPRYRVMLFDLREESPAEFVVAMIERGSEVGGGDVRSTVGCVARIVSQADTDDGRSLIAVIGVRRVRVVDWLAEDPYPRAVVEPAPAIAWSGDEDPRNRAEAVTTAAREVGGLAARAGAQPWPVELELAADPEERLWQLALLAPLATLDRQRLLGEDDPSNRCSLLESFLEEQRELIAGRLDWND